MTDIYNFLKKKKKINYYPGWLINKNVSEEINTVQWQLVFKTLDGNIN